MKLAPIFSNGAIFPAHKNICIFGEAKGIVTVSLAQKTVCTAVKDGKFRAFLPPFPYGGPFELSIRDEDESLIFSDIYFGEVYLMSGQSNMQLKLHETNFPQDKYFDDPLLRVFSTDRIQDTEVYHSGDGWMSVSKENAADLTAIGILTGEELRRNKDIPIGIITCYQGASVIESWLPKEFSKFSPLSIPDSEKFSDHFDDIFGQWNHSGDLYDAMLMQIVPYPLSGIVWYQGESDASDGEACIYKEELLALINVWRSDFLDPTLPFYIIQIADCDDRPWPCWHAIQKAQADAADEGEKIYCIESRDVCESSCIHPTQKYELSRRIANRICRT